MVGASAVPEWAEDSSRSGTLANAIVDNEIGDQSLTEMGNRRRTWSGPQHAFDRWKFPQGIDTGAAHFTRPSTHLARPSWPPRRVKDADPNGVGNLCTSTQASVLRIATVSSGSGRTV
jgi:hypothetical protein